MSKNKEIQTVRVEVIAENSNASSVTPAGMEEMVRRLAERLAAEIAAKRDEFAFQPFFNQRKVSDEIQRLQTVPEQRAWGRVFEKYGCIVCRRKDVGHTGCGCCSLCYGRILNWKRQAIRDAIREYDRSRGSSEQFCMVDRESVARQALFLPPAPRKSSRRKR